jgi:hypothetical protein
MNASIILLLISLATFAQNEVKYSEGYAMLNEVLNSGTTIMTEMVKSNQEIVKLDYDLVSNQLTKTTVKYMSNGFQYIVVAFGAKKRIADIDIRICRSIDNKMVPVAADTQIGPGAMLTFTPTSNEMYFIQISAPKMVDGYESSVGSYFMIISHN